RPVAQGSHARNHCDQRSSRVAERCRRRGRHPLRDPPENGGMSEAAQVKDQALEAIAHAAGEADLVSIEVEYLGRRDGKISKQLMSRITSLPAEEKAAFGQQVNEARRVIEEALAARRAAFKAARMADIGETQAIDV